MTEATQTVDPATLEAYTGKRVSLTFRRAVKGEGSPDQAPGTVEETVTQEGRVEMGAAIGLMFKEKGKSNVQLVEIGAIVDVTELATREPKVAVKTLQPVGEGRVRQHLADRHGFTVEVVNGLTEAKAKEVHDEIDHSELAHKHEVPQAEAEAEAIETPAEDEGPEAGE